MTIFGDFIKTDQGIGLVTKIKTNEDIGFVDVGNHLRAKIIVVPQISKRKRIRLSDLPKEKHFKYLVQLHSLAKNCHYRTN